MNQQTTVANFKKIDTYDNKMLHATISVYEHQINKGRIIHIDNGEERFGCSIGFLTPSENDYGIAHIIEHSVLCGSDKYPCKEPFVLLLKSSFANYLNGITDLFHTRYPFVTNNENDFKNIFKVYLDALYRPLARTSKQPFLQEGIHIDFDEKGKAFYQGVVFNEMMSGYNSLEESLYNGICQSLFPGSCYQYNSGGNPYLIPNLTYEQYLDFYSRHYHPTNSVIVIYGKLKIDQYLKYIAKNYYDHYQYQEVKVELPKPQPIINKNFTAYYQIEEKDQEYGDDCLVLNYAIKKEKYNLPLNALYGLLSLVLCSNDSKIYQRMIKSKLCNSMSLTYEEVKGYYIIGIVFKKIKAKNKTKIINKFYQELQNLQITRSIKERLLAQTYASEFKTLERDYLYEALSSYTKAYFQNEDIHELFLYQEELDLIKTKVRLDPQYFLSLIDKYILHSEFYSECLLIGKDNYNEELKTKLDDSLMKKINTLSSEALSSLQEENTSLHQYQKAKDSPQALASMPKLNIKDLKMNINSYPLEEEKIGSYQGIYHPLDMGNICCTSLIFDISHLNEEEVRYLKTYLFLVTDGYNQTYSHVKLDNMRKKYLGSYNYYLRTFEDKNSANGYRPYLIYELSFFTKNVNKVVKYLNCTYQDFAFEKNNLIIYLKYIKNYLNASFRYDGGYLGMIESKKYFSSSAYFSSLHEGLSMYEFIKSLIADYSYEVIISKINQVINKVFIASSLLISYGVNTSAKKKISQGLSLLKLGSQSYQPLNLFTPTKGKNVGLLIKENVNINVLSYPLNGIDEKDLYQYYVVQKILSLDYLWNNVRVKNGAYGTALIASDVHSVTFYSEEDPNVKKTYDIFKKFFSYYQKHKISYANLKKYIIATSASLDDPTKLKSIFNSMTIRYLSNLSSKEHERRIQELFENTNVNDIYHLFELLKMDDKDLIYFSVGNKENLSQMDFDQIIELD